MKRRIRRKLQQRIISFILLLSLVFMGGTHLQTEAVQGAEPVYIQGESEEYTRESVDEGDAWEESPLLPAQEEIVGEAITEDEYNDEAGMEVELCPETAVLSECGELYCLEWLMEIGVIERVAPSPMMRFNMGCPYDVPETGEVFILHVPDMDPDSPIMPFINAWAALNTQITTGPATQTIQITGSFTNTAGAPINISAGRTVTLTSSVTGTERIITQNRNNVPPVNPGGFANTNSHFTVNGGTLTLANSIVLSRLTTLTNPGGGVWLSNSGTFNLNSTSRIQNNRGQPAIFVSEGSTATINGTVRNSHWQPTAPHIGTGGLWVTGVGSSAVLNATAHFYGNRARSGGAIMLTANASVTMNGGTLSGNIAADDGGGVAVYSAGSFTTTGNTNQKNISNNTAGLRGGGISVQTGNATATLGTGTHITGNSAWGGGGVHLVNGLVTMGGGTSISNNTADMGGGMYWEIAPGWPVQGPSNFARTGTGYIDIYNNRANTGMGLGGGILVAGPEGNRTLPTSLRIGGNRAINGGGLAVVTANITMPAGVTIGGTGTGTTATSRNEATGIGGGVYLGSVATFTMTGGTIGRASIPTTTTPGNRATLGGGGIAASGFANLNVQGGTIRGNFAGLTGAINATNVNADGGGVHFNSTGTFNLSGGTIRDNRARYGGGILVNNNLGTTGNRLNATGGTIQANTARLDGGGIFAQNHMYENPLPTPIPARRHYPGINITNGVTFGGATTANHNVAQASFNPPGNAATGTHIANNTTSTGAFTHPLNNLDVNYRGALLARNVVFNPQGGTWPAPASGAAATGNQTRTINQIDTTLAAAMNTNNLAILAGTTTGTPTAGALGAPTRDGYTFLGWYTTATGAGTRINHNTTLTATLFPGLTIPGNQTITVHARWSPLPRNVVFNPQGGTWPAPASGADATANQTRTINQSATTLAAAMNTNNLAILAGTTTGAPTAGALGAPTREGYTFLGWYTTATGAGTRINHNTTLTATLFPGLTIPGNQTITVHARWSPLPRNVVFNPQGGTWPAPASGADATANQTRTINQSANTLVAAMNANNQGILAGTTAGTPTAGALGVPTRTGYTFLGWYTTASGAGTRINHDTILTAALFPGLTIPGNQTITVHARWQLIPVTPQNRNVVFNPQGGTWPTPASGADATANQIRTIYTTSNTLAAAMNANNQGILAGTTTGTPTAGALGAPSRAGYTFLGWYTTASGAGTRINHNTTLTAALFPGITIPGDQTITVHARWTPLARNVVFNPQGGTWPAPASGADATANQTRTINQSATTLAAAMNANNQGILAGTTTGTPTAGALGAPSRAGYTFLGWYTTASGAGTRINHNTTLTAALFPGITIPGDQTITLHARWERNQIDFQFIKIKTEEHWESRLANAVFSVYRRNEAGTGWESVAMVSGLVSAADGVVEIEGLTVGSQYRLVETAAPLGFYTPSGYWIIHINIHGLVYDITTVQGTSPNAIYTPDFLRLLMYPENYTSWRLPNREIPPTLLPYTGGSGMLILLVIALGAMLLGGAAMLIQWNRKRRSYIRSKCEGSVREMILEIQEER